jgi:FkbM family methyltransferase
MGLLKRLVDRSFALVDCELVPKWRLRNLDFARHLATLIESLHIDCVLDVGANKGQFCKFLRHAIGYKGLVVSFEPLQSNIGALNSLASIDDNLIVKQCALGPRDGTARINVMADNCFSSFLRPDNSGVREFDRANVVDHCETVEVRRLDGILGDVAEARESRNLYLKMDTQGFDLEVLAGAERLLPRIVALQSEMSVLPIYAEMPSFEQSLAVLRQKGFEISGMYPVSRDPCHRIIEFDCVMVNGAAVARCGN